LHRRSPAAEGGDQGFPFRPGTEAGGGVQVADGAQSAGSAPASASARVETSV